MRSLTDVRYPLSGLHFYTPSRKSAARAAAAAVLLLLCSTSSVAQTYGVQQPRRQFVTVTIDWLNTEPLHFASDPLEDLVGREVASAQRETYDYRTRDEAIQIDVLEFRKRNSAMSVAVYPLGLSSGATLGIRGSIEQLPAIRIAFAGDGSPSPYAFTGGRAYDIGAGVYVADRSAGWGLGSMAFVIAGLGRIDAEENEGSRTFAEGGGGVTVGPFGVQLAVKFAWNRIQRPVEHRFLTIPITLRAAVSF
jgi:hypothetical protein